MNKIFFFVLANAVVPLWAMAETPTFKVINCIDANSNAGAPVFLDVSTDVPNSATGTRFQLGNLVSLSPSQPGQYKDVTEYGDITNISTSGRDLTLQGSFSASLTFNLDTGKGTLDGAVKYDPQTGEALDGTETLKDYPVTCTMQ